ncbi:MAG: MFS transporter [Anaerolineae bacterium]|nr:MFS transporter [Anaerolineae bacterium]
MTNLRASKRERWAWYLYDFGNSAYAAVILLAVYAAYFKDGVVGGPEGSRLWGIAVGAAMFIVALLSPWAGAVADFSGSKKRFLFVFTGMAVIFSGALFFVREGNILLGMGLFIAAEVGYRSAQVFYNGLLPEIAGPEDLGRVSGNGWAIGSFGGIVCLLIVLPLIALTEGTLMVRVSFVITAVFFALATIPLFTGLREKAQPNPLPPGQTYLKIGLRRLATTFRQARQYRELIKFMIAYVIYNDGIMMTLNFSAIIGMVLYGMNQNELIIFMIIVQVTSVIGAFAFGHVVDRWRSKRAIALSLALMVVAVLLLMVNDTKAGFFAIGGLAGFALTGTQSVSRTMVSYLSPPGQSAEFYGLYSVAGRASSFIGPAVYGTLAAEAALWFAGQGQAALVAEQLGHRVALFSIVAFLVVGLGVLMFVHEERGHRAAHAAARPRIGGEAAPEPVGGD